MSILKKYLVSYKLPVIFGPVFKLVEALLELTIPIIITKIIDVGIKNKDKNYILFMGALMLIFAVLGYLSALIAQYFCAQAGVSIVCDLRKDLFDHIIKLSLNERDLIGKKTIITRLTNDTNRIQTGINMFLRLVFRSPFILIGSLIMAFYIDKKLSSIFLIVVFLLFLIVFLIMKKCISLYTKLQADLDKLTGKVLENLSGIRVIRAFNSQKDEIFSFKNINNKLYKKQKKVSYISSSMMPLTNFVVNIAVILILYKGAVSVHIGDLTQGNVVALVNYLNGMLIELLKMANLLVVLSKGYASIYRVGDVFKINNSLGVSNYEENTDDNYKKILEFKDVDFGYHNTRKFTVSNINLTLEKGKTLGIIGGTGCGKSSLIKLIPRLYDANNGEVIYKGKNVKDYNLGELRNSISMVEQEAFFFSGSIRENLLWGDKDATDEEIMRALDIAQAKDIVEKKSEGLDFMVSKMGKNLSGGQKQRLSIARALIKKPELLILDDAASALDYLTDSRLRSELSKLNISLIIISGRVASIRKLDNIIVMDDGKIVGMGTHSSLYNECSLYKEICLSQLSAEEV